MSITIKVNCHMNIRAFKAINIFNYTIILLLLVCFFIARSKEIIGFFFIQIHNIIYW